MASIKHCGTLGIVNLVAHAQAMCAKFVVFIVKGTVMVLECLAYVEIQSQGSKWQGL